LYLTAVPAAAQLRVMCKNREDNMTKILYASKKETNYENFCAVCPYCGFENIYNRVSDLRDTTPIDFKQVICFNSNCRKPFNINSDSVNAAYEMLIFDCYALKKQKRYSFCIVILAQSFEVFFSLYFRISLIYRPFNSEQDSLDTLNKLLAALFNKIEKFAFSKLRNLFLNLIAKDIHPKSLAESEKIINNIPALAQEPSNDLIESVINSDLKDLLKKLKSINVPNLRNKVVHKVAYRPTIKEVETSLSETREIIFGLKHQLGIKGEGIGIYS
jgi:hypothetical protein